MLIITNISKLIGILPEQTLLLKGQQMQQLNILENAYLIIDDQGFIHDFGTMDQLNLDNYKNSTDLEIMQLSDRQMVLPGFVDSHTHIVFPAWREIEYVMKIKGMTYEQIAQQGGGILNTAKKTQNATEDELFKAAAERIKEVISLGTTALEIKSGYGLTTESELKMLRVIKRLKQTFPITIKATFLGAHAIPLQYRDNPDKYVDIVINEMLPAVAQEQLAEYVDVFCDKGFFTQQQTERILDAAARYGLKPKIHANELGFTGGVQAGVKYNAVSVDHLEYIGTKEVEALLNSNTMPTLLPATSFFLNLIYAPARKMIDSGLPIALASDFNPGSSPSGNMKFVMSLGTLKYKLLPEEAFNAVTINAAFALELSQTHGSITRGKIANLIITKPVPSFEFLSYFFAHDVIDSVIVKGQIWDKKAQWF